MFCSLALLYILCLVFLYMFADIFYSFIYFSSGTFDTFSVERAVPMNIVYLIE